MAKFRKLLLILFSLMFGIWLIGAVFVMLGMEYDRKSECIEKEGFLKGYFWCETDDNSIFWGWRVFLQIIEGLSWPYDIIDNDYPTYKSTEFKDPASPVPRAFLCSFLGMSTDKEPNAPVILIDYLIEIGAETDKIDIWLEDAKIMVEEFVADEQNTREYGAWYWAEYCEEAFRKIQ